MLFSEREIVLLTLNWQSTRQLYIPAYDGMFADSKLRFMKTTCPVPIVPENIKAALWKFTENVRRATGCVMGESLEHNVSSQRANSRSSQGKLPTGLALALMPKLNCSRAGFALALKLTSG